MAGIRRFPDSSASGEDRRNRRTGRVLLGIMLILALATILAGIRW